MYSIGCSAATLTVTHRAALSRDMARISTRGRTRLRLALGMSIHTLTGFTVVLLPDGRVIVELIRIRQATYEIHKCDKIRDLFKKKSINKIHV